MSAGWQGALIGVGTGIVGVWLFAVVSHYWATIRAHWKDIAGVAAVALVACAVIGGVVYLVYLIVTREPPPKAMWVHPTMTPAAQKKAKAECRIAAYEALGSGSGKFGDPVPGNRADYIANCLTAKGFSLEQVDTQ